MACGTDLCSDWERHKPSLELKGLAVSVTNAVLINMELEVAAVGVADVDRATRLYGPLASRLDTDIVMGENYRLVSRVAAG
jgi:hypothetical protein